MLFFFAFFTTGNKILTFTKQELLCIISYLLRIISYLLRIISNLTVKLLISNHTKLKWLNKNTNWLIYLHTKTLLMKNVKRQTYNKNNCFRMALSQF